MAKYLELGSGKVNVKPHTAPPATHDIYFKDQYFYVDKGYHNNSTCIGDMEYLYLHPTQEHIFSNCDIFEFLDAFKFKFDRICANRIFEHMFYDSGEIGRLLDACNQITNDDATLEIIVPDFDKIIGTYNIIRNKDLRCESKNSKILLINTECNNTRVDPHGSMWSRTLARHYINNEGGTWKIKMIEDCPLFKGRDIYMKITCTKG